MIALAFYKGRGRLLDRVIRWVTRSSFSHVEILRAVPTISGDGLEARAWSSSGRDGGVREKSISFKPGHWEFVTIPWAGPAVIDRVIAEIGNPYDYTGLLASQALNLRRHRRDQWFCSEICAHALELSAPQELSPGGLYCRILEMNRAYLVGWTRAGEPPED
ncbi:MAG: hypothetical protein ABJZ79_06355 [Parasphingorhabdus sp.]|uniref:hypothetical protein n=1 Tax=Parasphingorhabdus sp. TaxID=2709688 RepID=UPI0032991AF3